MIRLAITLSKLQHRARKRQAGRVGKRALGLLITAAFVVVASHTVAARPWHDHRPLAQVITRAAACAGAEELLRGGIPLEIEMAAISRLAKNFRRVHGHEVLVTQKSTDQGQSSPEFSIAVSLTHQQEHYLLEDFVGYRPTWVVQSVIVDEANFDQCARIQGAGA